MSTPPRIDELRKKFDENPRRYFAPLANEYRKAGDLTQAISLCREFLPKQPGHMSGHIVFGQALYEAGELGEARSVFESALSLDPENLIALRHLGDIAKAGGDAAAARRWYERVLDADPRNDDIAAQLATLGSATPASVRAFAPAVTPVAPSMPTPSYSMGALDALPTPDAAMRAVDFDVVNAQIARYTPLDLDAIEGSVERNADPNADTNVERNVEREAEPVEPAPFAHEPLDLDAMDAIVGSAPVADSRTDVRDSAPSEADEGTADEHIEHDTDDVSEVGIEAEAAADTVEAVESGSVFEPASGSQAALPDLDIADPAEADPPVLVPLAASTNTPHAGVAAVSGAHASIGDEFDEAFDNPLHDSYDAPNSRHDRDDPFEDESFEEGLLAPEWPDTSDLLARFATPRSATPISVEVTPETVAAFGREPDDDVPYAPISEEPLLDVAAPSELLAPEGVSESIASEAVDSESIASEDAAVVAVADEASFASMLDDVDMPGSASDYPEPSQELRAETESETVAETVAESDPSVEFSMDSFADFDAQQRSEATVDWSTEARAETPTATPAFTPSVTAPVMHAGADASPAFVTETMGELLVSQGFTSRAVEVYEELVRRRPYDPVLTSRLTELRDRLVAESAPPEHDGQEAQEEQISDVHESPVAHNTPLHNTPLHNTPLHNTPLHNTPLHNTPLHNTPLRSTPLRAAAVSGAHAAWDDESETFITSRELFARIAARRVPRRTPPQPVAAVASDPSEGLAALFGNAATGNEDTAARALADAFAPISAGDMASGSSSFELEFGQASPASNAPAAGETMRNEAMGSAPMNSAASTPSVGGNAGFSFDRFFPDPATGDAKNAPPAAPAPGAERTPPGEDLAQFSAWLKGLGNA